MTTARLPIEERAATHRTRIEKVATLWRAGWRTTKLSMHFRTSAATVTRWLKEAQLLGLVPPRRGGRPSQQKQ